MNLNPRVVTRIECTCPPSIVETLGDMTFYRETYSEFQNEIYFPKSSITDASEEFKATEIYQALKEVFEKYPDAYEVFLV